MTSRSGADEYRAFVAELACAPDLIARLLAKHVPDGGMCAECTRPGRGTRYVRWPCSLWALAAAAQALRDA